ncbi:Fatty acid synthase-like [Homarus americanus]|uniref:Fatty acid synthase n=1 Tax=Homarus americanus TaxID=6706 RepID=A0A8J5J9F5_HOMAM|nr:Fatty acid synthase-like [Homarus americanus]
MPAYAETLPDTKPTHPHMISSLTNGKKSSAGAMRREGVAVSGMSGRFPESNSVEEFAYNLYNGVDMVTEDGRRWTPGAHGLPRRSGKLPDLAHFDSAFFSVSPRQAHAMDPQLRLLLELTYEAILDAGMNPSELRGRRVGVYMGVSSSESEEAWTADPANVSGYALTGCCRAMFPNRISYTFDFKGPSFAIDTACSSSMVALQTAWSAVSEGEVEAAIVGGTNLTLKPQNSMQFHALNMLASDGKCKSFDATGNGYVRSEAAVVIFLQRATEARRVYAHVVHARANTDGNKDEGVTFPSGKVQRELLQDVYNLAGISPLDVSYVEAHGTGTKAGDPQEVGALAEVFCAGRSTPLLMGSVKSNMGHSEPASGLCSIVKVLLAMQRKELPGNLHFSTPNPDIPPLVDGRIKVVSENTPWSGGFAAVNSFGFGGANVHVLLQSNGDLPKPSSPAHSRSVLIPSTHRINPASSSNGIMSDDCNFAMDANGKCTQEDSSMNEFLSNDQPRLVVASGRTVEAVTTLLEGVRRKVTPALCGLIDKLSDMPTVGHPARGFVTINSEKEMVQVSRVSPTQRPLWLVFSGMGSQWTACGRALLRLPTFVASIRRCHAALQPLGLDLTQILTNEDPAVMSSTAASFSAIAAMQVGLVDLLRCVGVQEIAGLVGHSVGELGCAYTDGALTAEQTVLAAYWRGQAVQEASLPLGAMAAVGLGAAEAEKWCKDGVIVACHNAHDSVTLSGPKEAIEAVLEKLSAEGIFCRAVNSEGVAFHHPSLKAAAPRLLKELIKVIPCARPRSSRWVSSSVPEARKDAPGVNVASADYLVNNLLSPVLFAEALEKIPAEALVVEVSPHGLLQAILRRSLPQATPIPLIRKDAKCTLTHFLEALGKMYVGGVSVDVSALYPPLATPVPPSTPSIASLIGWDHSQEWDVARFNTTAAGSEYEVKVDLESEEYRYLEGHTIDGRVIYPATGYLVLAWKALCRLKGLQWEETPVTFSDVTLHQATVLSSSSSSAAATTLTVRILLIKGEFEVVVSDSVAASGRIHHGVDHSAESKMLVDFLASATQENGGNLLQKDVYKELRLRGYQYGGIFQGIAKTDLQGTHGSLMWKENWVAFLDTMLQFSLVGSKQRALMLPTRIRKITVDPSKILGDVKKEDDIKTVFVKHNSHVGITACDGVVIQGLKATLAPRRPTQDHPLLETFQFVPRHLTEDHPVSSLMTTEESLGVLLDLALENTLGRGLKIVESAPCVASTNIEQETILAHTFMNILNLRPMLKVDYILHTRDALPAEEQERLASAGVAVKTNLASTLSPTPHFLILHQLEDSEIIDKLNGGSFIFTRTKDVMEVLKTTGCQEIASVDKIGMKLFRKNNPEVPYTTLKISSSDGDFSWVATLKEKILSPNTDNVWLVSSGEPLSGILGLVNCLRKEPGGDKVRCVFVPEGKAEVDSDLLASDLAINVCRGNLWGTHRFLPLSQLAPQPSTHALLNVATRGDLTSLTWFQMASQETSPEVDDGMKVCDVYYAPLNFRDVMLATGKLPPDALPGDLAMRECILGLEFAGVSDGKRVMGLVAAGGLATSVRADPLLTWLVPASWSLKDAATVPVVYATAYYALVVRGRLQRGESVLIHAGSGGVGQAAISIALSYSCTVYTTVSTAQKKAVLQKRFPQLRDENFANSRDVSFEYAVLERTGGRGVDVVLNSLAGDLLQASVRCLREHGRFLEIGKADLSNNTALGMAIFLKNVTFHGILLDALFDASLEERQRLNHLVAEGLTAGVVTPLPSTLFTRDSAEDAFRYMATGKHIGKVVLEVKPEVTDSPASPNSALVQAVPRVIAHGHMVYVITGGLGGLGLELAGWLISRGAKKLVLTSRRGITTGYQALCVQRWRNSGVSVRVMTQDASTIAGATTLLQTAGEEGPVGGVFHLAMVLQDSFLENQSPETFRAVNTVKGDGAVALDIASRISCPNLHYWVAFSSVTSGRGNAGQTNYGWANRVCEGVAESRVQAGLPGVVVQWGGIGEVGVLADNFGDVEVGGTKPQSVRSVLECLDVLILSASPVVSSFCLATRNSGKADGIGGASLVKSIANILGMKDVSKAPLDVTLGDLGLDSLMSVEVKQTLEREADLILTAPQVRELTLRMLQDLEKQGGAPAQSTLEGPEATSTKVAVKPVSEELQVLPQPWLTLPLLPEVCIRVLREGGSTHIPLFLAAPIQGTADPLTEVAKRLDRPVYGLQYPPDLPHQSITEMAKILVQELQQVYPSGDYAIGGYSYGTAVALEMTCLLQANNRVPTSIVLLDGSQSYVSGIIEGYKSKLGSNLPVHESYRLNNKAQEQVEVLLVFAMQFTSVDPTTLKKTLLGLKSWEERVNLVADLVTKRRASAGVGAHQNEHRQAVKAAELLYQRLLAGSQHKAEGRVSPPTLLVRARDNPQAASLGRDYGIVGGVLKIEEVAGTHETFVLGNSGQQVASLIQTFLQEASPTVKVLN